MPLVAQTAKMSSVLLYIDLKGDTKLELLKFNAGVIPMHRDKAR